MADCVVNYWWHLSSTVGLTFVPADDDSAVSCHLAGQQSRQVAQVKCHMFDSNKFETRLFYFRIEDDRALFILTPV